MENNFDIVSFTKGTKKFVNGFGYEVKFKGFDNNNPECMLVEVFHNFGNSDIEKFHISGHKYKGANLPYDIKEAA